MIGTVSGAPRYLLQIEAAIVFVSVAIAYAHFGTSWWVFVLAFFLPDLSMLAYGAGKRAGAIVYNAAHCYAMPFACIGWGSFWETPLMLSIGLIWVAHIGFDRSLGFGLKYAEGFAFTHLSVLGKPRSSGE